MLLFKLCVIETKLYIVTEYDPAFFMLPILLKINKDNINAKSPEKTRNTELSLGVWMSLREILS